MQYRRTKTPGATYFFTAITYQRQQMFNHLDAVVVLRLAFHTLKQKHPNLTMQAFSPFTKILIKVAVVYGLWTLWGTFYPWYPSPTNDTRTVDKDCEPVPERDNRGGGEACK